MPAQYYLPCACGQRHLVSAAQAGQTLTCVCGATLDVPTLRGLAALEVVPERASAPRSSWGPRQGVMLVAALLVVAALLTAAWLRNQSQPGVALTSSEAATMDNLTPAESLQAWQFLSQRGLHSGLDAAAMQQAHFAGLWVNVALALAGVALAVLVLAAAAPLLFGKPAAKRSPSRA
ncbi:MAG: hypothetical protein U0836_21080 [Pirellulales bacterium]